MSIESMIAQLQSVIRELNGMPRQPAPAPAPAAPAVPPAVQPANPLPAFPAPSPTNWMEAYQADCLLWANAIQHGLMLSHPDANLYRNNPGYIWPDRARAQGNQGGTLTRPGGTSDNGPRAI